MVSNSDPVPPNFWHLLDRGRVRYGTDAEAGSARRLRSSAGWAAVADGLGAAGVAWMVAVMV